MSANLSLKQDEFELLRSWVEQSCGISVKEDKLYLFESRLAGLVVEAGCTTFGEFYLKARGDSKNEWKGKIIDAITTNETLWFRDASPFTALKEVLFPEFYAKNKPCRIWSAACSTGQEPYSIAITACEYNNGWARKNVSIFASDISSSALMLARNARYNTISMSRGMPEDLKKKYFTEDRQISVLNDDIKQLVKFEQFNLQSPFSTLGKFDIIFLRNVAIYFSPEFKTALFKKLASTLNPHGYLFVGSSESLMGYSSDFSIMEHGRCLYYKLK